MELDVVAESLDGKFVLVGGAKWNDADIRASSARDRLASLAKNCPYSVLDRLQ
ncbi:MAG: hypothetical protein HY922_17285 [Elusimicrobia bacterium]|nr:hypothetical protein [Elusimicrobiota bacterium]